MSNPLDADQWQEVDSSNIEAVGTKDDYLIVQFKKGGEVYRYAGLADMFDDLVAAPSAGKFFAKEIRSISLGERLSLGEWPED